MAGFGRLMRPLDILRGLSVLTRSGTKIVPRLVSRLTYPIYGQVDLPVTSYGQVDVPTFSHPGSLCGRGWLGRGCRRRVLVESIN